MNNELRFWISFIPIYHIVNIYIYIYGINIFQVYRFNNFLSCIQVKKKNCLWSIPKKLSLFITRQIKTGSGRHTLYSISCFFFSSYFKLDELIQITTESSPILFNQYSDRLNQLTLDHLNDNQHNIVTRV